MFSNDRSLQYQTWAVSIKSVSTRQHSVQRVHDFSSDHSRSFWYESFCAYPTDRLILQWLQTDWFQRRPKDVAATFGDFACVINENFVDVMCVSRDALASSARWGLNYNMYHCCTGVLCASSENGTHKSFRRIIQSRRNERAKTHFNLTSSHDSCVGGMTFAI